MRGCTQRRDAEASDSPLQYARHVIRRYRYLDLLTLGFVVCS